jgi:hypothetical protein
MHLQIIRKIGIEYCALHSFTLDQQNFIVTALSQTTSC